MDKNVWPVMDYNFCILDLSFSLEQRVDQIYGAANAKAQKSC